MRDWKLPGFTTGSGCLAPGLSTRLFRSCVEGDYEKAEALRSKFVPLEDLRDAWGPARVLHHATAAAGLAATGPVPPYVSALSAARLEQLKPVAGALLEEEVRA
jgi:dihydrodipicolinate synthase/N-acetylneuraminate lyase